MSDYRLNLAKFTWGASFANTLTLAYRLDNVKTGDEPRAGGSREQSPSGVEDAWTVGTDYVLTADMRYLAVGTVWDGTTGVRSFLSWGRDANVIRFFPDSTSGTYIASYLVEPMSGQGELESDGTRKLTITLRNSTTAYDGY